MFAKESYYCLPHRKLLPVVTVTVSSSTKVPSKSTTSQERRYNVAETSRCCSETSLQRRCNATTLQRRCNDVVATLCVCWVLHLLLTLKAPITAAADDFLIYIFFLSFRKNQAAHFIDSCESQILFSMKKIKNVCCYNFGRRLTHNYCRLLCLLLVTSKVISANSVDPDQTAPKGAV